jgi:hypothetical protein
MVSGVLDNSVRSRSCAKSECKTQGRGVRGEDFGYETAQWSARVLAGIVRFSERSEKRAEQFEEETLDTKLPNGASASSRASRRPGGEKGADTAEDLRLHAAGMRKGFAAEDRRLQLRNRCSTAARTVVAGRGLV